MPSRICRLADTVANVFGFAGFSKSATLTVKPIFRFSSVAPFRCLGAILFLGLATTSGSRGGVCANPTFVPIGFNFGDNHSPSIEGDFNGDGRTDWVAVRYDEWDPVSRSDTNGAVSVALAYPDGSFQQIVHYDAGPHPQFVAVGDVNGDGKPDLVVLNQGYNSGGHFSGGGVSVLLGNGDGSFRGPINYLLAGYLKSLAVADFNLDGKADVAVTCDTTQGPTPAVSVLLGQSDGTLRSASGYDTGTAWTDRIVAADFNGDGKPDLAVAFGMFGFGVRLGNGDGTFQNQITFDHPAQALAVGDFNKDGKMDLAALGFNDDWPGVFTLILGRGDGTFSEIESAALWVYGDPSSAKVGDFNGDGNLDLLIRSNEGTNGSLTVLLGKGDGAFRAITLDEATASIAGLASSSGVVAPPVTVREPTFALIGDIPSGWYGGFTTVGDFNGDGIPDLVTATQADPLGNGAVSNYVSVRLGEGNGFFLPPTRSQTGGNGAYFHLAVGDFNGDGKQDVALTSGDGVSILLGKGDGDFQPPVDYKVGPWPSYITVADINGDSKLDLAVVNYEDGTVSILLGRGDGSFEGAVEYEARRHPNMAVAGDFNGDGKADLAITVYDGIPGLSLLFGNGDGTFQNPVALDTGSPASSVVAADFNGDGRLDLAVASLPTEDVTTGTIIENGISVLLSNGDGTFQPPVKYGTQSAHTFAGPKIATGDFNGDGNLDLIVSADVTTLFLGNGDGTFQPAMEYPGYYMGSVAVADFNQDGKLDWVTGWSADLLGHRASVWLNTSCLPSPALTIARANEGVTLSWPLPSVGYVLEFTTSLNPTNWQPALEAVRTNAGMLEVTVPVSSSQRYFRLHKQ